MTRQDWLRLWMHFPIGAIAAWTTFENPVVGGLIFVSTWCYEWLNDWRKHDESWKDLLGITWGYGIVAVAMLIGKRIME